MQPQSDLAIILKTYPYQERDRVVVALTQNYGRITGIAKGAIHSKRYGGTLDFLACSKIQFIQKPNADMARIEGAIIHHEFSSLQKDFEKLTAASFCAELCLKLFESDNPSKEMFSLMSNVLFHIDSDADLVLVLSATLAKMFKVLGYTPTLLRCAQCLTGAHELIDQYTGESSGERGLFFWSREAGGMVCHRCASTSRSNRLEALEAETLLLFQKVSTLPFKEIILTKIDPRICSGLFRILNDFLYHHIPGIPIGGLKSAKLLGENLSAREGLLG